MAVLTDLAIAIGRVAATALEGAFGAIQFDLDLMGPDEEGGDPETSTEPAFGPPGFYSRPKPPVEKDAATGNNPEGVCELVGLRLDDRVIPLVQRDLRLAAKVNPKVGEIGLVGYGGGFLSIKDNTDENGSELVIYVPRNNPDGSAAKASAISIDSTEGNQSIGIVHEGGASITMNKDSEILLMNPAGDAWVHLKADGITLNGNVALAGSVNAGDKDPAQTDFVVQATGLLAWIGQVNAALVLLAAAVGKPVPAVVAPTAIPKPTVFVKAK